MSLGGLVDKDDDELRNAFKENLSEQREVHVSHLPHPWLFIR